MCPRFSLNPCLGPPQCRRISIFFSATSADFESDFVPHFSTLMKFNRPEALRFTTSAAPPSAGRGAVAGRAAPPKLGGPEFFRQRPCDLFSANCIRCKCRRGTRPQFHRSALSYFALRQGHKYISPRVILAATLNKSLPVLAFLLRGLRNTQWRTQPKN
jgi:hypothetical protein